MPPYSLSQLQQMGCGAFKTRLEKGSSTSRRETKRSQTDRTSTRNKHCQFPDPNNATGNWKTAFTRAKVIKSRIMSSSSSSPSSSSSSSSSSSILQVSSSKKRLANFVVSSGRIIERLLAENRHRSFQVLLEGKGDHRSWEEKTFDEDDIANKVNRGRSVKGDHRSWSEKTFDEDKRDSKSKFLRRLYNLDLEESRSVKCVAFSKDVPPLLAIALGPREDSSSPPPLSSSPPPPPPSSSSSSSLVSVWDLESMDHPAFTLASSGEVSTCCFGPQAKSTSSQAFVVAGMEEGGLCLWDCGEPEGAHTTKVGSTFTTCRWPSFTTEGQLNLNLMHSAEEIVSVACIPPATAKEEFRVVSVNRAGYAIVWDVCDVPFAQNLSQVSGTGLGLRIGSRYKLLKSCVVDAGDLAADFRRGGGDIRVTCFSAARDEVTTLAVGTSEGLVYRLNRFGARLKPPLYFSPLKGDESNASLVNGTEHGRGLSVPPVLGLDFLPRDPTQLLCCHLDGTICLYRTSHSFPTKTWVWSSAVLQVKWHPDSPGVFFALDAESNLLRWNVQDAEPITVHALVASAGERGSGVHATGFSLSCPGEERRGQGEAPTMPTFVCSTLSNGRASVFVLADDDESSEGNESHHH